MIETHMGTVYTDGSAENHVAICREAAQMLEDNTACEILNEDTDNATYYEAILSAPGDTYVRIYYYYVNQSQATLILAHGQRVDGSYVWHEYNSTTLSALDTTQRYARLSVVNHGAAWSLAIRVRISVSGSYYARVARLDTVILRSGLTGNEVLCSGGDRPGGNQSLDPSPFPNPYGSGVFRALYNGEQYSVPHMGLANAKNNIVAGKILLFPSLIYFSATENNLGVPTIGEGKTYYMGIPDGVSLPAYTEFSVNGGRYVSLGNVAIPST